MNVGQALSTKIRYRKCDFFKRSLGGLLAKFLDSVQTVASNGLKHLADSIANSDCYIAFAYIRDTMEKTRVIERALCNRRAQ